MADHKLVRMTLEDWKIVWGIHAERKKEGIDENMSDTMHFLLAKAQKCIALEAQRDQFVVTHIEITHKFGEELPGEILILRPKEVES